MDTKDIIKAKLQELKMEKQDLENELKELEPQDEALSTNTAGANPDAPIIVILQSYLDKAAMNPTKTIFGVLGIMTLTVATTLTTMYLVRKNYD